MQEESLPFVANTDHAWFDFLSQVRPERRLDEVNFWQPRGLRPMRRMLPGTLVFFRLKGRRAAIGGYGYFVHWRVLPLGVAWQVFGVKNGDPDASRDGTAPRAPVEQPALRDVPEEGFNVDEFGPTM